MPRFTNRLPNNDEESSIKAGMETLAKMNPDEYKDLPEHLIEGVRNGKVEVKKAKVTIELPDMPEGKLETEAHVFMVRDEGMGIRPSRLTFVRDFTKKHWEGRTARMYTAEYHEKVSDLNNRILICRDNKRGYAFISYCDENGKPFDTKAMWRDGKFDTDTDFIAKYSEGFPGKIAMIGDPDYA